MGTCPAKVTSPETGRPNGARIGERNVDSPMLTARVLVAADREVPKDGAVGGPRPRPRRRCRAQCPEQSDADASCRSRCPESEHSPDGSAGRPTRPRRLTVLLQGVAVQRVPGSSGQPRDDLGCGPTRRSGLHQLRNRVPRVVRGARVTHRFGRCEDERHLPARRLGEASSELGERSSRDLLEALRQLSTNGRSPARDAPRPARRATPATAAAIRRRRPRPATTQARLPEPAAHRSAAAGSR